MDSGEFQKTMEEMAAQIGPGKEYGVMYIPDADQLEIWWKSDGFYVAQSSCSRLELCFSHENDALVGCIVRRLKKTLKEHEEQINIDIEKYYDIAREANDFIGYDCLEYDALVLGFGYNNPQVKRGCTTDKKTDIPELKLRFSGDILVGCIINDIQKLIEKQTREYYNY